MARANNLLFLLFASLFLAVKVFGQDPETPSDTASFLHVTPTNGDSIKNAGFHFFNYQLGNFLPEGGQVFSKKLEFKNCGFSKIEFLGCTFEQSLTIGRSDIEEGIHADNTKFENGIDLSIGTNCYPMTTFFGCTFNNRSYFGRSSLENTDFSFSTFNSSASFSETTFIGPACFRGIKIKGSGELLFDGAYLPDTLDFSAATDISTTIVLTRANTDSLTKRPVHICLYKSDSSKIIIDYTHFRLYLPDTLHYHSYSKEDKIEVYENVLNSFKTRGQLTSYQALDIEYRHFRSKNEWLGWLTYRANGAWWNYGYDKGRVFLWAAGFLFVFSMITFFFLGTLHRDAYQMENFPPEIHMCGLIDQAWYSFVYTCSVFFRLTLKMEKLKFENKVATAYILIVYTIGLVCLAYMANFVLQK